MAQSEKSASALVATDRVLRLLHEQGQSPWLDNIRRGLITSGELEALRDAGVSGVTSNPTIFEKAVGGSTDYDQGLARLARAGKSADAALWELMVEDIQAAADVFHSTWEASAGADGFVSIEVAPGVARDADATLAMVRDLHRRCDRPNVMVKIPGTKEGLVAIRRALAAGININVTLIFSVQRYAEVVDAFMSGLEDLARAGGDLSRMASVASFFVSRVDTKVDQALDQRLQAEADPVRRGEMERLRGKIGIANSKLAYRRWAELHSGPRWEALAAAGARPQRCLWASTSTKDERYSDTMYVDALIGPATVDTLPPQTLVALRDHGRVERTLDLDVDAAVGDIESLGRLGVDLDQITQELEEEGVDSFSKSFESLLGTLERELEQSRRGRGPRQWHALGRLEPALERRLKELEEGAVGKRLWESDRSLWPAAARPAEWMGWLGAPAWARRHQVEIEAAADAARGFAHVVVLGMGGSSLAPSVFAQAFGSSPGHPQLLVLDTTDPASISELESRIDPARTLFVVASKSGGTTETLAHFSHFKRSVELAGVSDSGDHFVAITDPGSPLEQLARSHRFRSVFLNPPDIGGRYSALSFFGLIPAALAGVDLEPVLSAAERMARESGPEVEPKQNPGVWLGAVLGDMARQGRNKLTLLITPPLASLGAWVEQLIAESTGKAGQGIVPVNQEPRGEPQDYGADRLFVQVRLDQEDHDPFIQSLTQAGHPVVTLTLGSADDLGAEFMRWELATAIAGSILGIDPFDQPNVQESKDNTAQVLEEFARQGRLPEVAAEPPQRTGAMVASLLGTASPPAYFAIMAYVEQTAASEQALARLRSWVRARAGVATTVGYGPRFLHSTGQLHKGGPPTGIFLQVVQQDQGDVEIPGRAYGFSTLKAAQALGDLSSLQKRGYPVLRVDLGSDPSRGWSELEASLVEIE
ncbi:MAG TPA: bifunctional transaldolase/phosoglucose isomerase [Candidatus Nitrosotalea sp.]|nr:bifunctional transaldolase/phosoglucose isomerase [Candidatus Nitrosotalea sp.]